MSIPLRDETDHTDVSSVDQSRAIAIDALMIMTIHLPRVLAQTQPTLISILAIAAVVPSDTIIHLVDRRDGLPQHALI